jgi:hydrogenase nickel incorporation protein HypA/HybF
MHELSIAISIIELAEEEAERRGGVAINAVHLKLGPLAGVVKEALLASYGLACEGTALERSRLIIEEVPIVVFCPSCRTQGILPSMQCFACSKCGAPVSEILQGRELEVTALEIQP